MSFKHQYPLDEHSFVEVIRDKEGDVWSPRIELHLYRSDSEGGVAGSFVEVARMMLRSLEPIVSDFAADDFVQHGLKSVQPGKGYAHILHDFVISHHLNFPFSIRNIYSTEPAIDNIYFAQRNQPRLYISESAKTFWNKRVKLGKAEYIESVKRYRIHWSA